jgi:hypothetical protein
MFMNKIKRFLRKKYIFPILFLFSAITIFGIFYAINKNIFAATSPWTQSDWSGEDGQFSWEEQDSYDTSQSIETAVTGQISLQDPEKLTNTSFDTNTTSWIVGKQPSTVTDLSIWHTADSITGVASGAAVVDWYDISGSGHIATQATTDRQPLLINSALNGYPIVRFDGINDYLLSSTAPSGFSSGSAMFAMMMPTNINDDGIFSFTATGVNDYNSPNGFLIAQGGANIKMNKNSNLSIGSPQATGEHFIGAFTFAAGSAQYRKNGGTSTNDNYTTLDAITLNRYVLSSRLSSGGIGSQGENDIAEMMFFPRSLIQEERQGIETYLGSKYAITVAAPTMIMTRDTSTTFDGSVGSARIVTTGQGQFVQLRNLGTTDTYTVGAYVYKDGSAITSSDVSVFAHGEVIATNYTDAGNGWYLVSGSVTGVNAMSDYGLQVESGKTVYVDNVSLTQATSPYLGTLTSSVFDTTMQSEWGTVEYTADTPANTTVEVKVRSGNRLDMTDADDFSTCPGLNSGDDLTGTTCVNTQDRFIQYQLLLSTTDMGQTPVVEDIEITFTDGHTKGTVTSINTYYVSPSGNDSNLGTIGQPFLTIQHAIDEADAGDTIYVRSGSYGVAEFENKYGNPTNPITLAAYPGEEHLAIIQGTSYSPQYGLRVTDSNYITVKDLAFTGTQKAIGVEGSHHVIIEGNLVHDVGMEAISYRKNSSNGIIRDNEIYNMGMETPQFGEGIYIGNGSYPGAHSVTYPDTTHHITISGNEIYHTGGQSAEGINIKGEADNILIENNVIHDLIVGTGGGINFDAITVDPNDGSYYYAKSVNREHIVRNNTIYNITRSSAFSDGNAIFTRGIGASIYNNVLYDNQHYGVVVNDPVDTNQHVDIFHNTFAGNDGTVDDGGVYMYNDASITVTNNIGSNYSGNIVYNDNLFVDAANKNFQLASDSTAIDTAINVGITSDLLGTLRPQRAGYDFGAYEFIVGITNIQIDTTMTTATISFDTSVATTSEIEYGTTTSYGTTENGTGSNTSHEIELSGLTSCTTYHFRIKVTDGDSNEYTSQDEVFTTACITNTPTPTNTPIPTNTPVPTATPTPTDIPTSTPTGTIAPTATPTPTTTPTNTPVPTRSAPTNNSTNTVTVNSSVCTEQVPGENAPKLYAALAQSTTEIMLYFTDAQSPYDRYVVEYGTKSGSYTFGSTNIGGVGTRTYQIGSLSPNTKYFFRVRAGNGCAAGSWSNEISATTKSTLALNSLNIVDSELVPVAKPSVNSTPSSDPSKPTPTGNSSESTAGNIGGNVVNEEGDLSGYELTVKVVDTEKKAVENAKVTVHSKVQEGHTDKDGFVSFKDLEPGEHRVIIAYANTTGEQSINLTGDNPAFALTVTIESENPFLDPLVLAVLGALLVIILVLTIVIVKRRRKTSVPTTLK